MRAPVSIQIDGCTVDKLATEILEQQRKEVGSVFAYCSDCLLPVRCSSALRATKAGRPVRCWSCSRENVRQRREKLREEVLAARQKVCAGSWKGPCPTNAAPRNGAFRPAHVQARHGLPWRCLKCNSINRSALIPREARSEAARKSNAARSPEARSEAARKSQAARSPEARSEAARKSNAARSPEARREAARKGNAARSPEARREAARKGQAARSPEARREAARKGKAAMSPEARSEASRKGNAAMTPEARREAARKGNAASVARTPEARRAGSLKSWEARRAKAGPK